MKSLKFLLTALALLSFSFISSAQLSGANGFAVAYVANTSANPAGQFKATVAPTGASWSTTTIGTKGEFPVTGLGPTLTNVTFALNDYVAPWGPYQAINIPLSTFDAMPMGGSLLYTGTYYSTFTFKKTWGYSIVGATFAYTIEVSVYHPW